MARGGKDGDDGLGVPGAQREVGHGSGVEKVVEVQHQGEAAASSDGDAGSRRRSASVTCAEWLAAESVRRMGWLVVLRGMSTRWIRAYGEPLWWQTLAERPTSYGSV